MSENELVWIHSENIHGELISRGAWASTVRFLKDGNLFEIMIENEDLDFIHELHYPEFWEEEE
jgi:hypothetical protein